MKITGETKLFLFLALGAVILGGLAFVPMLMHPPIVDGPKSDVTLSRRVLIPPGSHIEGSPTALFALVEFSDLQCPHCRAAQPTVDRQLKLHAGDLCLVSHLYKVTSTHEYAELLARAAEAAGAQGKYFEMCGRIFKAQEKLAGAKEKDVRKIAEDAAWALGLDRVRFRADMDSTAVKEAVKREQALGNRAGIKGTPAFFFVDSRGKIMRFALTSQMNDWLNDPKHWK